MNDRGAAARRRPTVPRRQTEIVRFGDRIRAEPPGRDGSALHQYRASLSSDAGLLGMCLDGMSRRYSPLLNVCFAHDSGRAADIPGSPLRAKSGHGSLMSVCVIAQPVELSTIRGGDKEIPFAAIASRSSLLRSGSGYGLTIPRPSLNARSARIRPPCNFGRNSRRWISRRCSR